MTSSLALLDQIEALVRRDPAGRGLISSESQLGPLCPGHLAQAAENLAATARSVAIVSGFFVPDADLPAAETDGPPGAVVLAAALDALGIRCTLVTDPLCESAVQAAARASGIRRLPVEVCPVETGPGEHSTAPIAWFDNFVKSDRGSHQTHARSPSNASAPATMNNLSQPSGVRERHLLPISSRKFRPGIATVVTTPAAN